MKIIRMLSDMIEDEIEGACEYVKKALEWREEYPDVAATLHTLSQEELKHITRLHGLVVDLIQRYREKQGEPPVEMMAVYEYLHKKHIDKVAEIKRYQEMYKEM